MESSMQEGLYFQQREMLLSQRARHDDRREGIRHDPRPGAAASFQRGYHGAARAEGRKAPLRVRTTYGNSRSSRRPRTADREHDAGLRMRHRARRRRPGARRSDDPGRRPRRAPRSRPRSGTHPGLERQVADATGSPHRLPGLGGPVRIRCGPSCAGGRAREVLPGSGSSRRRAHSGAVGSAGPGETARGGGTSLQHRDQDDPAGAGGHGGAGSVRGSRGQARCVRKA